MPFAYASMTVAVVVILIAARSYNYLLFHLLAELVTTSFAFTIFLLVWNSRTFRLVESAVGMHILNSCAGTGIETFYWRETVTQFHQPVIALTAHALRCEKERFLSIGFDGYVSKPLEIAELMEEMKRVKGHGEARGK